MNLSEPTRYLMFLQKQSGITDEVFHFWLSVPGDLKIIDFQPRSGDDLPPAGFADQSLRTYLTSPVFNQDLVFEATGCVRHVAPLSQDGYICGLSLTYGDEKSLEHIRRFIHQTRQNRNYLCRLNMLLR